MYFLVFSDYLTKYCEFSTFDHSKTKVPTRTNLIPQSTLTIGIEAFLCSFFVLKNKYIILQLIPTNINLPAQKLNYQPIKYNELFLIDFLMLYLMFNIIVFISHVPYWVINNFWTFQHFVYLILFCYSNPQKNST